MLGLSLVVHALARLSRIDDVNLKPRVSSHAAVCLNDPVKHRETARSEANNCDDRDVQLGRPVKTVLGTDRSGTPRAVASEYQLSRNGAWRFWKSLRYRQETAHQNCRDANRGEQVRHFAEYKDANAYAHYQAEKGVWSQC